jgi:hypothetical protein
MVKGLIPSSISSWRTLEPILPSVCPASSVPGTGSVRCLPEDKCHDLHLCMQRRPGATTHLQHIHLCRRTTNENHDLSLFQAMRCQYKKSRKYWERILWKLKRIDFVEVGTNATSRLPTVNGDSLRCYLCSYSITLFSQRCPQRRIITNTNLHPRGIYRQLALR